MFGSVDDDAIFFATIKKERTWARNQVIKNIFSSVTLSCLLNIKNVVLLKKERIYGNKIFCSRTLNSYFYSFEIYFWAWWDSKQFFMFMSWIYNLVSIFIFHFTTFFEQIKVIWKVLYILEQHKVLFSKELISWNVQKHCEKIKRNIWKLFFFYLFLYLNIA